MLWKTLYRFSVALAIAVVLTLVVAPLATFLPLGDSIERYRQGVLICYGVFFFAGFPETWMFRGFSNREHQQIVALSAGLSGLCFLSLVWPMLQWLTFAILATHGIIGARKMVPMFINMWRKAPSNPSRALA